MVRSPFYASVRCLPRPATHNSADLGLPKSNRFSNGALGFSGTYPLTDFVRLLRRNFKVTIPATFHLDAKARPSKAV